MLFLQIISKTNDKTLVRNTWAKLNSFRPYPHESGYFLKLHPFFGTNKPFFVHTKPVNPPSETSSCSVKMLAVHTNQRKKICGFKNVRTRVNMASVTANCEKQWRNSMERALYVGWLMIIQTDFRNLTMPIFSSLILIVPPLIFVNYGFFRTVSLPSQYYSLLEGQSRLKADHFAAILNQLGSSTLRTQWAPPLVSSLWPK